MTGTFAPDLTLHIDQGTTSVAELMHTAALALREALSGWFGTPLNTTVPIIDRPS